MFIAKALTLFFSSLLMITCVLVGISSLVYAKPFVPDSADFVLAEWDPDSPAQAESMNLEYIENLINQAQYPGKSAFNIGRANALLNLYFQSGQTQPKALYLHARILQHQHDFSSALKILDNVLQLKPQMSAAWLLKANIHLALAEHHNAKQACLNLIGQSDLLVASACSLEIESFQGKLAASYASLSKVVERYGLSEKESAVWLVQILADMAYRLNDKAAALVWLEKLEYKLKPVSYWALWADIQLDNKRPELVYDQLSKIVSGSKFKDDALLLRLVLAEQAINAPVHWQTQLSNRIRLRIQREDKFHAAEIARFFIEVEPNPVSAIHWAEINWQMSKLEADRQLLQQAILMQADAALPESGSGLSDYQFSEQAG